MASCFVIIDVQNGFVSKKTEHVPERIAALLDGPSRFDHVVVTQFVNTNSDSSPYVRLMQWYGLMTEESQQIHETIQGKYERVFRKYGYSCFTPEFEAFVSENQIDKIYFAGIDTDCCVLKSATDCFERNISFEVLVNYCASNGGEPSHQAALMVLRRTIGRSQINETM